MKIFGRAEARVVEQLRQTVLGHGGIEVKRGAPPRSSAPHPQSIDLEVAMKPARCEAGFQHHVLLEHPRTGDGFEYDFWREADGIAIEVMGYRADDEIHKDILKFHVHEATRMGIVLVPRYKWISSHRTDTNYAATLKALAFADEYMSVDALIMIAYDWTPGPNERDWELTFPE